MNEFVILQFDVIKIHIQAIQHWPSLFDQHFPFVKYKKLRITLKEERKKNSIEPFLSVVTFDQKGNVLMLHWKHLNWMQVAYKHGNDEGNKCVNAEWLDHWKRNSWPNCILIKEHKKGCDSILFYSSIDSFHRASTGETQ